MKIAFLRIGAWGLAAGLLMTGCLSDDMIASSDKSSGAEYWEEQAPADTEVAQRAFSLLNLEYPGMEAVREAVGQEEWGRAALALRDYYRYRSGVVNPQVNLLNTSLSAAEQATADNALAENGYRFKVSTFVDPDTGDQKLPYSYMNEAGDGIDWTLHSVGVDQELRGQLHRHQWFVPQAKAWYVTRDDKYLDSWMNTWDDWWAAHPAPESYPENNPPADAVAWVPLSVAARVQDMCSLMEYYRWADAFTPGRLTRFVDRLDEQVEFIKNNYWTDSNHRISQAQAVTLAGMLFPELAHASEWLANGSAILNEEVVSQYYEDGWLKDNDLHYHIGAIESFRMPMVVANANSLADRFPESYREAMRKMVEVEKYLIYPNYAVYNNAAGDYNYATPNFGDTRPTSWTRNILLRHLRNYRDLFPDDEELKWLASQGAEGKAPAAGIKCFEQGGHYTIRNGWTRDAMMMTLVNCCVTPKERWHRQWDNNNFELYVNGRQFFPDSGVFSYGGTSSTNQSRATYARTDMHSTLTLDKLNVSACRGVCLAAEERGDYDLLILENPSYEGLTHRRSVFFVDRRFFVILDEAYGAAAGTVNLNFHLLPGSDSEVVVDAAEHGAHTAFADGNNLLVRTFSDKELATATRTGSLSVVLGSAIDRKAYRIDQTKTADDRAARFITVLYPASDAAAQQVEASFADDGFSPERARLTVKAGGRTYTLSYAM